MADRQPNDQLAEEFRKYDMLDRERARNFSEMLESKAWRLYSEMLMIIHDDHVQRIMRPLQGDNTPYLQEFIKGTMYGLQLAATLPTYTVESVKAARQAEDQHAGKETET